MLQYIPESKLNTIRVFLVLGGFSLFSFWWGIPEHYEDPLWLRACLFGLFLSLFGVSFISQFVRERIFQFAYGLIFLVATWWLYLTVLNHYPSFYTGCQVLIILVSITFIRDRTPRYIFAGMNLLAATLIYFLVSNQSTDSFLFLAMVVFAVACGIVTVEIRTRSDLTLLKGVTPSLTETAVVKGEQPVVLVSDSGQFVQANPAFLDLFQIPKELIEDGRHDTTMAQILKLVKAPEQFPDLRHPGPSNPNLEFQTADGAHWELSLVSFVLRNDRNSYIWSFQNITKRKLAETSLLLTDQRMRDRNDFLMELALDPSLSSEDPATAFESLTKSMSKVLQVDTLSIWDFDWENENLSCTKLYRVEADAFEEGHLVHLPEHKEYFDYISKNRLLAVGDAEHNPMTQKFFKGEYTGQAGSLCHAQIRGEEKIYGLVSVERRQKGDWDVEDQNFISSVADLVALYIAANQRRQAQAKLKHSLALLKATFELSETGIFVVGSNGHILDYNQLFLDIWNLDPTLIQVTDSASVAEQMEAQTLKFTAFESRVGASSQKIRLENAGLIELANGRTVERFSKVLSVDGEALGQVWFFLDITARKKKEDELINRNFELDSFVYRASHDLKAPLNSIMGLIDIVDKEEHVEGIKTYVGMMDKSVRKLDSFIRQLTQFSQETRFHLSTKAIDFKELIKEIWSDLKFMDNAARVQLETHIEQDQTYFSDPLRWSIVLGNTLSNAVKYQDLEKGESKIRVEVKVNASQAVCVVEDNGIGIDADHLSKVFELFFRASVQASGSGLGLYITHNAVRRMEGEIDVHSEKGVGTRFTISVPNMHEMEMA